MDGLGGVWGGLGRVGLVGGYVWVGVQKVFVVECSTFGTDTVGPCVAPCIVQLLVVVVSG